MRAASCCINRDGVAFFIERRPLRHYMPHADGRSNPMMWWAWRWENGPEERQREWLAGPCRTRKALEALL